MTLGDAEVTEQMLVAIEQRVIACVLVDPSCLKFIEDDLVAVDFADPGKGRIFEGFYELLRDREPINILTVADHLTGWGVRGIRADHLHAWTSKVSSSAEVGWYAAKVHELAIRREVRAEGGRLADASASSDAPGEVIARAIDRLQTLQVRGVREEVRAVTLDAVLAQDAAYDWAIEDLLEKGDRLILTGSEGGGKTTLLRQIAILSAAGLHPFTGFDIDPVRVLFVDTENTAKQWARETADLAEKAAGYGRVDPRESLMLDITKRMDLGTDRDLGRLHKLIDMYDPQVLFIGPLYRLVPHAIDTDDEAAPLLTALDTIHDRGVALIIEAHSGHGMNSAREREMRPRGSSALLGWPEFGLGLRIDKGAKDSKTYELARWRGHRDARRKWPFRLVRGGHPWPWSVSAEDARRAVG
jgi:hypothetical protein